MVGFPDCNASTDRTGNDEPGDDRAYICVHWRAMVAGNIDDHDCAVGRGLIRSGGSFNGGLFANQRVEIAAGDLECHFAHCQKKIAIRGFADYAGALRKVANQGLAAPAPASSEKESG